MQDAGGLCFKDVKIVKSQLYEDKADSLIVFFLRIPPGLRAVFVKSALRSGVVGTSTMALVYSDFNYRGL